MRQIEQEAERIVAHFEPISLLLASDDYLGHLRTMRCWSRRRRREATTRQRLTPIWQKSIAS